MRLKQIKLSGFKSFVDSTAVGFPAQMTAVVGPNGCGKSNVIDAVRWVLGESSAKNLRGDAMTDVIFNGSAQRKPVSQASVELVFENTQGRLQGSLADRSEIAIKRLVTREAQSTYFLNGSKCRRRDITDIFLGTGLGPRSYAIIEQGMISRLIESKPAELRVFLEEAAGISKYKERRRETETRIKQTRENLARLNDVREELGKSLEKLKRQASAAARFKELKAQERKLKAELACLKWLHFQGLQQKTALEISQKQTEIEKLQSSRTGDALQLLKLKQQQQSERDAHQQAQSRYYSLGQQITKLEQTLFHQHEKRQRIQLELQSIRLSLNEAQEHVESLQTQHSGFEIETARLAPEIELCELQLDELREQLERALEQELLQAAGLKELEQQLTRLIQERASVDVQYRHHHEQSHALELRLGGVKSQQASLVAFSLDETLPRLKDAVAHCEDELEQALKTKQTTEGALKSAKATWQALHSQQVRLEAQLETKRLMLTQMQESLKAQRAKEAEFLTQLSPEPRWALAVATMLALFTQARVGKEHQVEPKAPYVLMGSTAKTKGSLAEKVAGVWPEFFNHIQLAQSAEEAIARVATLRAGESIICPDGRWFGGNWQAFGLDKNNADNALLLAHQVAELTLEIEDLALNLEGICAKSQEARVQQDNAEQALVSAELVFETVKQQLQHHKTQYLLHEQQHRLQTQQLQSLQYEFLQLSELQASNELQLDRLASEQELLEVKFEECEAKRLPKEQSHVACQEHTQQCKVQQTTAFQRLQLLKVELQSIEKQREFQAQSLSRGLLQLQQFRERESLLKAQEAEGLSPSTDWKEQLQLLLEERAAQELRVNELNEQLQHSEQALRQLEQGQQGDVQQLALRERELADLQLLAEGYRVRGQSFLEQLSALQVNFKELSETLPAEAQEQSWQMQLEKVQESLARLGPINLAAIEEFEQQNERKIYLDRQDQDLTDALETLETAIRKIDKETRQKFKETFDEVNDGLQNLFPKVFGGGSAYLDLTEEDLLETGVTIMARPPGKKNSTIHLLSGGEKALTALSLVFSIFRLNPAPFCMLDEVDAPLDDANTGRFCNLVREMSDTVQFIYISHNKIAMEMATQLMGVTMQEPGVSRVVAVDVEDAVKMAQA